MGDVIKFVKIKLAVMSEMGQWTKPLSR